MQWLQVQFPLPCCIQAGQASPGQGQCGTGPSAVWGGNYHPYSARNHSTERQAEELKVQTILKAECSLISFKILAPCPN